MFSAWCFALAEKTRVTGTFARLPEVSHLLQLLLDGAKDTGRAALADTSAAAVANVVGATVEDVGFDKSNTAGGLNWLLSNAIQLVPEFEHAALANIWTGLRPMSQDTYPVLGKAPGWENVILATGHGAGGFELSAITGKSITELIISDQIPVLIRPFGLERFMD